MQGFEDRPSDDVRKIPYRFDVKGHIAQLLELHRFVFWQAGEKRTENHPVQGGQR